MKKLLSIIATMALCSTMSVNLVACNNDKLIFDKTYSTAVEYRSFCVKMFDIIDTRQLIWDNVSLLISSKVYAKYQEKLGKFIKDTDFDLKTDGTISKINFAYKKLTPVDVGYSLFSLTELYDIEGARTTT